MSANQCNMPDVKSAPMTPQAVASKSGQDQDKSATMSLLMWMTIRAAAAVMHPASKALSPQPHSSREARYVPWAHAWRQYLILLILALPAMGWVIRM